MKKPVLKALTDLRFDKLNYYTLCSLKAGSCGSQLCGAACIEVLRCSGKDFCKIIPYLKHMVLTMYILWGSKWRVLWDEGETKNQSKESVRELKKNKERGILYSCSEVCVCMLGQCTCKSVICVLQWGIFFFSKNAPVFCVTFFFFDSAAFSVIDTHIHRLYISSKHYYRTLSNDF